MSVAEISSRNKFSDFQPYLSPGGQAGQQSPAEMRDVKPVQGEPGGVGEQGTEQGGPGKQEQGEACSDIMKSSIRDPGPGEQDKVGEQFSEYPGYHQYPHQPDLAHPGYGGYSTTGFPLASPLSRPRNNKSKAQSGKSSDHHHNPHGNSIEILPWKIKYKAR